MKLQNDIYANLLEILYLSGGFKGGGIKGGGYSGGGGKGWGCKILD